LKVDSFFNQSSRLVGQAALVAGSVPCFFSQSPVVALQAERDDGGSGKLQAPERHLIDKASIAVIPVHTFPHLTARGRDLGVLLHLPGNSTEVWPAKTLVR